MVSKGSTGAVPRLFGTNGVRGVVNSPQMDVGFAQRLGQAIGTFMKGPVMIGTDARTSNEMLKAACASGIMASGCQVIDCGVVPTPTLQYAVKNAKVGGGVVVTASHNPPEFNGIKCIDPDGTEMSRANEEAIEGIYHREVFAKADWNGIGKYTVNTTSVERYLGGILSKVNVGAIRKANLRVAADCSNGAASGVTPKLLERLGVRYVTLNADPNGAFPGHNSEPTPENTKDLVELVRTGGFDLGFVHDGDADRTIFVDGNGRYLYGDRSLAIIANYLCRLRKGRIVVTPVSSSMCVEDAVRMAGGSVIYTRVGSPTVARVMMERGGIFWGEENGGLIFADHQYCRDGPMAAAKMLEIVSLLGDLASVNDKIPAYSQYKTKTPCPDEMKPRVMTDLLKSAAGGKIDTTDGLKVYVKDGWVLVRPSGTESIIRIFTESKTPERAKDLAESTKKRVEAVLKTKR
jgi:phosphomannomutase/phosphoglucomutase